MRGSPLRQLLGVALLLLLTGGLVWSLTRPPQAVAAATPTPAPAAETVDLELTLTTTSPATVEFSPWNNGTAKSEVHDQISHTAKYPAGQKIEVIFRAKWPDQSKPQALRAVVSWDGEAIADRTFWGTGTTEDVLSFRVPQP